nr:hypothetical protein CFP56_01179 [Quercus suber]
MTGEQGKRRVLSQALTGLFVLHTTDPFRRPHAVLWSSRTTHNTSTNSKMLGMAAGSEFSKRREAAHVGTSLKGQDKQSADLRELSGAGVIPVLIEDTDCDGYDP